jgi:ADP-ribosylglycohydrolase
MPGWDTLENIVKEELIQSVEEGRYPAEVDKIRQHLLSASGDPKKLVEIHQSLLDLPIRSDFPFNEPNDLESIKGLRKISPANLQVNWDDASLLDKMHGAWLGRCVGCALGKPIEGFMGSHNGLLSFERIKAYLQAISPDEWPIKDYIPEHSPADKTTGKTWCKPSTREHIAYMESDDDIRYTVLGQILLKEKGASFSTIDVANNWINHLSYSQVCTAETQAYRNLTERYEFHMAKDQSSDDHSYDWNWVATNLNPYREWIGAQIRVDSYGYAAPGNPELAAEFAWRDSRLSHVKNGIYGAMMCSSMIAASFATDNVHAIVDAGMSQIPETSRLYSDMQKVIGICGKHDNDSNKFESVIRDIYEILNHYNPVHTNNNAGICVAAILLSGGDFEKAITISVMGGLDTDCNGATVGSVVGAITGAKNAPKHWTHRLNDTLNSEIVGYHPIAISECAKRSVEIAKKINMTSV